MERRINKTITYIIFSFWVIILVFGVLTILSPDWLEELSDPGKDVEARHLKTEGDKFLRLEKYPLAIAQYIAAIKIVPDYEGAIGNLAIAYQKTGNYEKAIISFNHLIKLKNEYPGVIYYNLGDIYEKINQPEKALSNYLLAAGSAAYPEKSYQKSGELYMEKKDWPHAILNFKKAVDNRQTIKNAYEGMLLKTQKSFSDTSNTYIEIKEVLDSKSYLNVLSVYDEKVFNEQLSNDVDLAKTYNNIGYCLAMQEKYEEALPYLKIAIRIMPNYSEAINNLRIVDSYLSK